MQHPLMIKTVKKMGIEGKYLTLKRPLLTNPQLICSVVENWKLLFQAEGQDKDAHSHSPPLLNIVLEALARAIRQEKAIQGIQTGK